MSVTKPSAAEKKARSNHTRDLHAWLHQVALDRNLPHTAFKVAYIIGEHVNRESGEAWPSTERIAQGCALKQSTVVGLVRRLEAAGHLAIDPGQAGRGKSHRYRMILKHRGADILPINKTSGRLPENIGATAIKHRGPDMNPLEPSRTIEGAAPPRTAVPVDKQRTETRDNSAPDGADLRYLLHEAREAYALSQTQAEPLRTILSDALSIMPKSFVVTHITASPSCQDFLASIASAKMELTAYSS